MEKFNCAHSELVELHKIIPNPRNPNKHPERQVELLAKIIDYQGQRLPLVVSKRSGFLVSGHGRLEALKKLGWNRAAVDFQDFESEAQEFAHLIADNKIAELADHDDNFMIEGIKELELEGMDFELLGMPDFEINKLIDGDLGLDEKQSQDGEKKYILEVEFPNDMELADVRDDLLSRGYIVKEK